MQVKSGLGSLTPFQIGSVRLASRVLLAPMAGVTDWPFRVTVKEFGVGLVVAEMLASRAVIDVAKNPALRKKLRLFDPSKEEGPVSIQLVGYDPDIMAEAAKINEDLGAQLLDINMGCPVKKVVKTDAGAALMRDEDLAQRIISSVVRAVRIPVTVKMRLGWDEQHQNAATLAQIAEAEGAAAVAVHGRTRSQFYEGTANWGAIRRVKEAVCIPVIGNGDVTTPEAAQQLLDESGADAVMIGRGACGRPWFPHEVEHFLHTGETLPPPPQSLRLQTLLKHWHRMLDYYGTDQGVLLARKHLSWASKGLPSSAEFRALVNSTTDPRQMEQAIEQYFGKDMGV